MADPHDLAAHDRELSRLVEARRQVRARLIRKDTPADRSQFAELSAELDARLEERTRIAASLARIRGALADTMMSRR